MATPEPTVGPIALIGLPGSGKSTIAAELGRMLGRPVVGLDELIEAEAGRSIADIFATDGEGRFRELESTHLARVLDERPDGVIDGGGGLVLSAANRALLGAKATTVWIDAADDVLLGRLVGDETRPLLAGDPAERLRTLRRERLGHYTTTADAIAVVDGLDEQEAAREVIKAMNGAADRPGRSTEAPIVEDVALGQGRSYPVYVGSGAVRWLDRALPDSVRRVAVITQPGIGIEVDTGRQQQVFTVEDGEQAKRLEVVGDLASRFARWGLTRADAVVSVGGGVVSDLAGFVAASYHRGVPVVHVSTTLLGQIDAAIGGKCGVNLPEGKNLVGAFWQPTAVICDTDTLDSLPPREFVSGMGELAKYHFLGGGRLDRVPLAPRVARSVRIKADVVAADEREGDLRAILNYGHTLAHALETAGRYDLRHGEAVGIGLVYAAELARLLGRIDDDRVAEHRRVVAGYGLDVGLPPGIDRDELIDLFGRDKKAVDGITFVLDGPAGVEPVKVEDRTVLLQALERLEVP